MTMFSTSNFDINNLIFGGVVLGSATAIYFLGYSCYLGYNLFYSNESNTTRSLSTSNINENELTSQPSSPVIDYSLLDKLSDSSIKGNTIETINTPNLIGDTPLIIIDSVESLSISTEGIMSAQDNIKASLTPFNSNSPIVSLPDNIRLFNSDKAIQVNSSTTEMGIQTSDQLLLDTLNELLDARNSEQEELSSVISNDIYSPLSPISRYFNSIPDNLSTSIQTSPLINNIDTPIFNQLQIVTKELNNFNSNITPISSSNKLTDSYIISQLIKELEVDSILLTPTDLGYAFDFLNI